MMRTYRAILLKDHVQWRGDAPKTDTPVDVYVSIVDSTAQPAVQSGGHEMAAALEAIANSGGLSGTIDPVEWQREIRADRDLPSRE